MHHPPITAADFQEEYEYYVELFHERHPNTFPQQIHQLASVEDRLVYALQTGHTLAPLNATRPQLRRADQDLINACFVMATCLRRLDVVGLLESFASETAKAAVYVM
jgi:hypothetical protein